MAIGVLGEAEYSSVRACCGNAIGIQADQQMALAAAGAALDCGRGASETDLC